MRSCTDSFFESRTRPCLLYQIKRCSGPCTGEIDFPGYTELVREANEFLSGRSRLVKQELAGEMEKASQELEKTFEVIVTKAAAEQSREGRFESPFAEITDEDIDSLFSE